MKQKLTVGDVFGLGLLVFSFFLGAGNLIFPPLAGNLAGCNVFWVFGGFIFSSVLLPLVALLAVARCGSFTAMMADLPKIVTLLATLLIFLLIGPLLITPRTGLVVYEMAVKPWLADSSVQAKGWSTIVFFTLTLLGCWRRDSLLDRIGKIVTPILLMLFCILAVSLLWRPSVVLSIPQGGYYSYPLIQGLLEGYHTMDTFGSLLFGTLIVQVLSDKGITDARRCDHYLLLAGVIAAVGLLLVYSLLFWLGATSGSMMTGILSGGQLLAAYVQLLFGYWGQALLGVVVILACLTTAIGLLSGFADHMAGLTPLSYRFWLLSSVVLSTVIANGDLTTLIKLSQPVMLSLYPPAIMVILLTLVRRQLAYPRLSYRLLLGIALLGGVIDAFHASGVDVSSLSFIPGFKQGISWVFPSLGLLLLLYCFPQQSHLSEENRMSVK